MTAFLFESFVVLIFEDNHYFSTFKLLAFALLLLLDIVSNGDFFLFTISRTIASTFYYRTILSEVAAPVLCLNKSLFR